MKAFEVTGAQLSRLHSCGSRSLASGDACAPVARVSYEYLKGLWQWKD